VFDGLIVMVNYRWSAVGTVATFYFVSVCLVVKLLEVGEVVGENCWML
jgi:hypothetical protein